MIQKVEMFTVKCDNCGKLSGDDADYSCWNDESTALDTASEAGWINHKENDYCPECWSYDEDDEIVLKINSFNKSAR